MEDQIAVMLVDDQRLFSESLKTVLESRSNDIKVVSIAMDGSEALELARKTPSDIILMDVRMPVMDGVQATKIIHSEFPHRIIMMLTSFDDDEYIFEAFHNGATGYLLKDISVSELITSLRAIRAGSVLISPMVATKLTSRHATPTQAAQESSQTRPPWVRLLSSREKSLLRYIASGFDNKNIAAELFISEQTVKNYVGRVYTKIGVHNRIKVMQLALANIRYLETE